MDDIPRVTRELPRGARNRGPGMDFEALIQDGENPRGFTAETANGTAKWRGTGWNKAYGSRMPQVEPDLTRPAGRTNRTGE